MTGVHRHGKCKCCRGHEAMLSRLTRSLVCGGLLAVTPITVQDYAKYTAVLESSVFSPLGRQTLHVVGDRELRQLSSPAWLCKAFVL
jgi:hypothetical protein